MDGLKNDIQAYCTATALGKLPTAKIIMRVQHNIFCRVLKVDWLDVSWFHRNIWENEWKFSDHVIEIVDTRKTQSRSFTSGLQQLSALSRCPTDYIYMTSPSTQTLPPSSRSIWYRYNAYYTYFSIYHIYYAYILYKYIGYYNNLHHTAVEVETEKKKLNKNRGLFDIWFLFSALSFGVNVFVNSATLTHYRDEHEVYTVPMSATDPRPMFFLKK